MMKGQQGPSQIFLLKTKDSHKLNVQPALENFQIKFICLKFDLLY